MFDQPTIESSFAHSRAPAIDDVRQCQPEHHGSSSDRDAGTTQFFEGAIRGKSVFTEIVLEEHPGIISAASIAADRIDSVA